MKKKVTFRAGMLFLTAAVLLFYLVTTGCGRREIIFTGVAAEQETGPETDRKEAAGEKRSSDTDRGETPASENAFERRFAGQTVSKNPGNAGDAGSADEVGNAGSTNQAEGAGTADQGGDMPQPGRTDLVMAVHVSGAVLSPGVYEMERGSRICDAVRLAGGFLPDADTQWCNQAQPLADGDHLTIHTLAQTQSMKEEGLTPVMDRFGIVSSLGAEHSAEEGTAGRGQNIGSAAGTGDDRVDLNTADEAQLMTLPGIGESRAQDILAYRSRNGRFTDTEELMQISGIGQKIYDRIKDRVRVS